MSMPQIGSGSCSALPRPAAPTVPLGSPASRALSARSLSYGANHDRAPIERYKRDIHTALVEMLDLNSLFTLPPERQRKELRVAITKRVLNDPPPVPQIDQERLIHELLDEILGLGPLESLLRDPTITDILINGAKEVYVERGGRLEQSEVTFRDDAHVTQIIDRIVTKVGRRIDESSPMVDARLPDGSRVNAVIPPLSTKFPAVSIRRFSSVGRQLGDLIQLNMLAPEMACFLMAAVNSRLNIIVSGGTGSGKTTFLNALSQFIPAHERIVTIEDAAELQLQQRHVVSLETRPANLEGRGAVTARDLVRNALRMRPDRIIMGECRGAEALDMLQAMNTGHDGSLTTLHANSTRDALMRLEMMVLMAGYDLPLRAIRQQVVSAVDLIVQIGRLQGGVRRVLSITEVLGMEQDTIITQEIFNYSQTGVNHEGKAFGSFEATGVKPKAIERFRTNDERLPINLFAHRTLSRDTQM